MTQTEDEDEMTTVAELEQRQYALLVWRIGYAPSMQDAQLLALCEALESDGSILCQNSTALGDNEGRCVQVCALGYCALWKRKFIARRDEILRDFTSYRSAAYRRVQDYLDTLSDEDCDKLEQYVYTSAFENWFDAHPRSLVFAALAAEIRDELQRRQSQREGASQ